MIKHVAQGHPLCITVTLVRHALLGSAEDGVFTELCTVFGIVKLDGIVVARSLFHSSMNYRSVVIFGKAEEITCAFLLTQRARKALCRFWLTLVR
jgi:hypothetical protein